MPRFLAEHSTSEDQGFTPVQGMLAAPSLAACVQDDTKDSPAKKQPQHQSGVVGDVPNQQLILQVWAQLCCRVLTLLRAACALKSGQWCRTRAAALNRPPNVEVLCCPQIDRKPEVDNPGALSK